MLQLEKISSPDGDFTGPFITYRSSISLGKSTVCDFIVKDPALKAKHLILSNSRDGISAQCFNSKESFTVNGKKVSGTVLLHKNDVMKIGGTTLKVIDHTPPPNPAHDLQHLKKRLEDVKESNPNVAKLLNDLKGELEDLQTEENQD